MILLAAEDIDLDRLVLILFPVLLFSLPVSFPSKIEMLVQYNLTYQLSLPVA